MIFSSLRVPASEFAATTGWDAKPQGMCRGEVCVPAPGALENGIVNVEAAADRLGMPIVHDAERGVWSLGAATAMGRTLATAVAQFPSSLVDAMGRGFDFASLRGRRIIMIAWASWRGCRTALPGWQALHTEIEPLGGTVVSVALDINPAHAKPWIDAAAPTHPSLIDTTHCTNDLFGFINVPMAVWIDENGMIVRPAEQASIERSPARDMEIPEGIPDRLKRMMHEVKSIPDDSAAYRAALVDWVRNGSASPYAMTPDEVVEASRPMSRDTALAGACFAMGEHLHRTVGHDAAVPYWRRAHALDPDNWTYKRQAWTLVTTPEGATENDLMQGPNDVYEGNWLDDVVAAGGGSNYYVRAKLERPK